jgi:hypothetical protein
MDNMGIITLLSTYETDFITAMGISDLSTRITTQFLKHLALLSLIIL